MWCLEGDAPQQPHTTKRDERGRLKRLKYLFPVIRPQLFAHNKKSAKCAPMLTNVLAQSSLIRYVN